MNNIHLDWLKNILLLKPLPAGILFLVSFLILFLPDKTASFLAINTVRDSYRSWIALLMLISGVSLLCRLVRQQYYRFVAHRNEQQNARQMLSSLSPPEQIIICLCVRNKSQTTYAPINNPILHGLSSKGLMIRADDGGLPRAWPFTITPWIWKYLEKHPNEFFAEYNNLSNEKLQELWTPFSDL